MISFAKVTSETYAGLSPVEDRIYYITDTGEMFLNGLKYSGPQEQADYDQSDSTAVDYIKGKPALADVATTGSYWSLTGRPNVPVGTGNYLLIANNYTNADGSTVTLEKVGSPRDNAFQYCTNFNNQLWYDYTLGTPITLSQYQYVMFRNKDGGKLLGNGSLSNYYHFSITGSVNVSGDVNSLKDKGVRYNTTGSGDMCYLFKDCTGITDASGLVLPSPAVYQYTYYGMFQGCTNMVYGPLELPAMTLGTGCYQEMFRGCTSLKNAPRLPAKVMAQDCYKQMFIACNALTGPVVLPGTTLAANCYRLMFNSCYALNDITILCSEIGADYTGNWVTSISSTGTLRCPLSVDVSTRGTDTIPAGWTVDRIDTAKPNDAIDYLTFTPYAGRTSTVTLTKTGSPADISLEYSTDGVKWAPYTVGTGITVSDSGAAKFVQFRGDNATFSTDASNYYKFTLSDLCYGSGNIMSLLDKRCMKTQVPNWAFCLLFYQQSNLYMTTPKLPATGLGQGCYNALFTGCTGIKIPPELPAVSLKASCYSSLFYGCTGLVYAPEIPAASNSDGTYNASSMSYMFNGCTGIKSASIPNFTALTGYRVCYRMFYGCSNLKHLKIGWSNFTPDGVTQPATDWLNGVPVPGIIEMPGIVATANRGYSTVPLNWYIDNTASPYIDWSKPYEQSQSRQNVWYQKYSQRLESTPSANTTVSVNMTRNDVMCLTVNNDITLAIQSSKANCIAYSELVLDIAAGVTVSEGNNIVFADALTPGKRNICVVRQHDRDGKGKLYVVDVEDLPTA